jgi:DNA-binding response OmpR family regulator
VVLALPHSPFADEAAGRLRRSGWRVYRATDCAGLRHLAWRAMPEVVVLPAEGFDESGWLTCVKLLRSSPRLRVILVGPAGEQAYAQFVGAEALLPADVTADDLADCIEAAVVQTA